MRNTLVVMMASVALRLGAGRAAAGAEPAAAADLTRARQRVPRAGWKGGNFREMSLVLNSRLAASGHRIRSCELWTVAELQNLQRKLFNASGAHLLEVYDHARDSRQQRFKTLSALEAHWAEVDAAVGMSEALNMVRRDGLCHEAVMRAVHHVPSAALQRLRGEGLVLPSLPVARHELPSTEPRLPVLVPGAHHVVHAEYEQQVSCQQCHTGTVDPAWRNASLPGPQDLPVDEKHRALARLSRCNYQMQPPCGACDGLGGRRWGDGLGEFTPMTCEVIHGPEVAPSTRGCYPLLGTAGMTGETRMPLQVFPTGKPGRYPPISGSIAMGDQGGVMRLRYDFGGMGSQVSVQTLEQAEQMSPGATAGISGGRCSCGKSIAGNFHACSFEANETLDPLNLPASEGGAAYLGKVRVTLDGDTSATQRIAVADHYLKWAFHFLVDADEASPSFGLPLRLYGPYGVRQVFDSWKIGDPAQANPDVWKMPAGCNVSAPVCSIFEKAAPPALVV